MTQPVARAGERPLRYDWQEGAACQGESIDLFFGPDGERPTVRREREARAVLVCGQCPVLERCREHALALPEPFGVWGGTTERDRQERRRAA